MKIFNLFIFLVLFLCLACETSNQEKEQASNSNQVLSDNLNEYFEALTTLQKFNGAVLVQKEGKILIDKVFNMQDDVNNSLYVSTNSQFDIHSISKLMAKACVVKLEKVNLIDREAKLSKYIPDFPKGDLISIQNLLENTSGLPRRLTNKPTNLIEKTPAELVELIKKEELLFTPGTETLYSNLGYQLLYFTISKIVNKPFVQYVNDEFFIPLEMKNSGAHFYLEKTNLVHSVKNHENDDGVIVAVPNFSKDGKNQAKLYSTTHDLLKFINHVKNEPYQTELKNERGIIGWSGGGDGILSHASANPQSGYEFVFFSNYDEIPFGVILKDVEKIMTNKSYQLPKAINRQAMKLDKEIMERYVGKYDMAEFNHAEFELRMENDSFAFYQNGERNGVLQAENDSTFFGDPKDEDYFIFRKENDKNFSLIYKYKGTDIVGKKK